MCGVVGFCDYTKRNSEDNLKDMLNLISHRGPDDEGITFYNNESGNIALGHRRLSILDLSQNGHQPMAYDNLDIIFNGEIYNYIDIKKELIDFGYKFNSNSDTEVILKAFHKWGIEFIDKLNGMFAIAIFDKKDSKIYLFRDRVGIKPLYYFLDDNSFLFASELKAFFKYKNYKKIINNDSLFEYFYKGYIDNNNTIFKSTYKLPKGSYLIYDIKSKKYTINSYWNVKITNKVTDKNYALQRLDELLNESVNLRLIADVDIGTFLSGGIDSSLITAIAQKNYTKKIKTFTIGFENSNYNEAPYAKDIANYLDTEHNEYIVTKKDFKTIIDDIPKIIDEPMADSSIIPTTILSQFTKKSLKVSLSADGGDELFGGYSSYSKALKLSKKSLMFNFFKPLFLKNAKNRKYNRVKSLIFSNNLIDIHSFYSSKFTNYDLEHLLIGKNLKITFDDNRYEGIDKLLYKDFNYTLPDQLLFKVDRATMFASLEGRVPILDYKVVEFAYSLDSKFRTNKTLLKELAYSYIPKKLLDRPKKGFRIPLEELLEYNEYNRFFDKEYIAKQNIFNYKYINYLKNSFINKRYNTSQIWTYILFQLWYEYWEVGADNEQI